MSNKEKILRDLEYINGGLSVYKAVTNTRTEHAEQYQLFDEWQDTIYNIMDMVEEDYENAAHT